MDAPAMLTRKHVPEDVGLRNIAEDEGAAGGQGQLHRDEKQHKPVLKKVKEKVKRIKNTLAGHGHGHGGEYGHDEERVGESGSTSSEEGAEDMLEREAPMEKGGYMEDVEDKPVAMESDAEVHGAPMYESARAPAVQDLVQRYEPARIPAVQEVEGDGAAPRVRLGDLGGPVVEDPAAPRSTTPAAREGADIGTTPVVKEFESMTLSDDPAHVGAAKKGPRAEEWKDAATDKMGGGASGAGAGYTDKVKNAATATTEYGKKLASTVCEKVAGGGTAVGVAKRDDERTEAREEEWKDAPAATDAAGNASGAGYTDKIKSAAVGTTEYGKQLATTVYDKVAGAGAAVGSAGKRDDERARGMPVSDADGEAWQDAPAAMDAASGPGYTDKIKSPAAGTTEYSKQLASTVYEKVAGVGSLRPQVGSGTPDAGSDEAMPVSDAGAEERKDTAAATDATDSASGVGYIDKIKSAATTVYEKVAGVGTAVVGKVQQATQSAGTAMPGVGSQQGTSATVTPRAGGQDKGMTVTGYIAEKLRPGDEDRALSEAISGAVQRRKEDVGGTVAQRVLAPSQVITKAREAVTSLTGGNRVSEAVAVQPTATGSDNAKEGVAVEEPVLHGEEIGGRKLNTNTM